MHHAALARADAIQDIGAPPEGGDRIAIAHRFRIGRQIGMDSIKLLRAARRHAKPCLHFIDDQHRTVFCAQVAQKLQPFLCG